MLQAIKWTNDVLYVLSLMLFKLTKYLHIPIHGVTNIIVFSTLK